MPRFTGRFLSIVFIGRQNPQILNHDFLISNEVLPREDDPFKKLFAENSPQPFTEFISTPVLSSIKYGPISITIEESRYQIRDDRFSRPLSSPIVQITKNYFGKLLRHTPLYVGGFNLSGIIEFTDPDDEQNFDRRLGMSREQLCKMADADEIRVSIFFSFCWKNGMIEIRLPKPKELTKPGEFNFNYEFKYQDIDNFLANLEDFEQVYDKFDNLLESLNVEKSYEK